MWRPRCIPRMYHTTPVDFFACSPPQYDARWGFVVIRLYADAQELLASTHPRTHLPVGTRPLAACYHGVRGYKQFWCFNTSRSFFISDRYNACFRAGSGWGSRAAPMRVILTAHCEREIDGTLTKVTHRGTISCPGTSPVHLREVNAEWSDNHSTRPLWHWRVEGHQAR